MDNSIDFYEDSSLSFTDSVSGHRRDIAGATPTETTSIKTAGEYNLRPRRCKRTFDSNDCLDNANSPTENADPKSDPFAAIPSSKRRKKSSGRGTASNKSKAPPLSKYRRKTANARERSRMQEINMAFERLRNAVPQLPPSHLDHIVDNSPQKSPEANGKGGSRKSKPGDKRKDESEDENCKMTKITTLRLAVNYIAALSQILAQSQRENGSKLPTDHHLQLTDSRSLSRDTQTDSEISNINSLDNTDNNRKDGEKMEKTEVDKVATEPVSSTILTSPNFADYFASTVANNSRVSTDKNQRDAVKDAFLGSDSDDPIGVSTTTISDEDLREFEEEYCPSVSDMNREPLTDDDLALIPDEAFVREFFSLHADAPGQQDDVFRLVATHQHDVADFA